VKAGASKTHLGTPSRRSHRVRVEDTMGITQKFQRSGESDPAASRPTEVRELEELRKMRAERRLLDAETRFTNVKTLQRLILVGTGLIVPTLTLLAYLF
jgi:hypothetical protein